MSKVFLINLKKLHFNKYIRWKYINPTSTEEGINKSAKFKLRQITRATWCRGKMKLWKYMHECWTWIRFKEPVSFYEFPLCDDEKYWYFAIVELRKELHKEDKTWYMMTSCVCVGECTFSFIWLLMICYITQRGEGRDVLHKYSTNLFDTLLIINTRDLCSVIAFFSSLPTKTF